MILMMMTFSNKTCFLYSKFLRFNIDEWSDVECHTKPGLTKQDLDELLEFLGVPKIITCEQRTVC